jgi:hypothetical protein
MPLTVTYIISQTDCRDMSSWIQQPYLAYSLQETQRIELALRPQRLTSDDYLPFEVRLHTIVRENMYSTVKAFS